MIDRVAVEIRRVHPEAKVPAQMTAFAAGFDLSACEPRRFEPGTFGVVRTGIAVAIPDGYEGQVRARSGLAARHGIGVLNGPGTIDADYRGEIRVILFNFGETTFEVTPGDRIAQLVLAKVAHARYVEVDELGETSRGTGGFGHTGTRTIDEEGRG